MSGKAYRTTDKPTRSTLMATKTRVSKTEVAATEVSLAEALAEERGAAPTLRLTEKALASVKARATIQRPVADKKYGRDWRVPGVHRGNLRHSVVEALATLGDDFTFEEAMAAIKGLPLNSGTPRSFIKAFIKSGYVA